MVVAAGNDPLLATDRVSVHVAFFAGATNEIPDTRHPPFADHRLVPREGVVTTFDNEVLDPLRTLVARTVNPARAEPFAAALVWPSDAVAVTRYVNDDPLRSPVIVHVVDVVVQDFPLMMLRTVYDVAPGDATHENVTAPFVPRALNAVGASGTPTAVAVVVAAGLVPAEFTAVTDTV